MTGLSVAARARRGLCRTFQRMELFDSMTVTDNVALVRQAGHVGASIVRHLFESRTSRADMAAAVTESLELCGITAIADRTVGSLPTGQRRLIELARVLAGRFRLLLLDEPSSGLDADETNAFAAVLERTSSAATWVPSEVLEHQPHATGCRRAAPVQEPLAVAYEGAPARPRHTVHRQAAGAACL